MKKIYTSYYANVKKLPAEMVPIGISQGNNRWFKGEYMKELAPTWAMLKMSQEEYDREFFRILSKLDAKEIYDKLPNNAVLLCYEKFNDQCHRRAVAEWLENELGIEVTEWGLKREECFPYAECCEANKGKKRKIVEDVPVNNIPASVQSRRGEREPDLFELLMRGELD
ncbi:DUF488 family protein [Neobacillus niacini]|uniref:DUF488 family protein, N3 subclade n=1 Tax=Neobacillus niacini TaxID=86668 RepID=UPI002FFE5032